MRESLRSAREDRIPGCAELLALRSSEVADRAWPRRAGSASRSDRAGKGCLPQIARFSAQNRSVLLLFSVGTARACGAYLVGLPEPMNRALGIARASTAAALQLMAWLAIPKVQRSEGAVGMARACSSVS